MKIFLFNPDDGVSQNLLPHLWMFLLKALTPADHEVIIATPKVQKMDETELAEYLLMQGVGLVGIGAMTRMIAKAYRFAEAVRKVGIPVVMGGPHVSEMPGEALGKDGTKQYADSVAIGETDRIWPQIVRDMERGKLKQIYKDVDLQGNTVKPDLAEYPDLKWDIKDLEGYNCIPPPLRPVVKILAHGWERFFIVPVETQRGCPYGCDFCTVTRFFGHRIRYRTIESVLQELKEIKAIVERGDGHTSVFFVDDNFAINPNRTKRLLQAMINEKIELPYFCQISINLLKDEELVSLLAESGCKSVFIGLESIDTSNLAIANKGHNKPEEYEKILSFLAERSILAITSFIYGFDYDRVGVAEKTIEHIKEWPPGLPVFGQLTPYPGTPLYERLLAEDRLNRPHHWLKLEPFEMAHTPLNIKPEEVKRELNVSWEKSYSPTANENAVHALSSESLGYKLFYLIARLIFRGVYFSTKTNFKWLKIIYENRSILIELIKEAFRNSHPPHDKHVASDKKRKSINGDSRKFGTARKVI